MVKGKRDLISPRRTRILHRSVEHKTQSCANFKVIVRVRPRNEKEISINSRPVIKIVDTNTILFDPKESEQPFFYHGVQQQHNKDFKKRANKDIQFTFDTVFGPDADNDNVFTGSTKNLIDTLMNGYNCSVFVYGATGAGKTHTMIGHSNNPGITYLTMKELFDQMDALKSEREFELGITYLEVYNETVNDLLNPGEPLHLREDGKFGVCVAGITMKQIKNPAELFELLQKGNGNRTQHPTDANAESSRSHAVFQVYVNMTNRVTCERRISKLSMIDLAGSERGAATGCKGMRFTEGANINKSLLALGNCINSLADGHRHVPYRDSKLTRLLKDSLGGNCQTVMIANISPSNTNYEDTYNTLRYATRAKKIKSNIKKNVIKNDLTPAQYAKLVNDLKTKITDLETQLNEKNNGTCNCNKPSETITMQVEAVATPRPVTPVKPPAVVVLPENDEWRKNLERFYKERETTLRQILRLETDIKINDFRAKFKESTETKLQKLCTNNQQFTLGCNRIQSTVESFHHKVGNIQTQLNDLNMHRKNLDRHIDMLLKDRKNPFEAQTNITDDRIFLKNKLCDKVTELFEKELEQRDKIEDKMAELLKHYYMLLAGYEYITDEMKQEYNSLLDMLQGVRHVTWQDKDNDVVKTTNINDCTILLSSDCMGSNKKQSIKRKLYDELSDTEETNEDSQLNQTFNLTGNKCNKTIKILKPVSAVNILPKVCNTTSMDKKYCPPNRGQKFPIRKVAAIQEGGIKKTTKLRRSILSVAKENKTVKKKKNFVSVDFVKRMPLKQNSNPLRGTK